MSLDLYLKTKNKRQYKGTGVYIRKNGETIELETIEEVKSYFPDADLSNVEERIYETYYVFNKNITHNLGEMAEHVPCNDGNNNLYQLLWRPEEHDITYVTTQYRECITECLAYMVTHKAELEKFNPSNGWGNYETLFDFIFELSNVLSHWDGVEEIEIIASR